MKTITALVAGIVFGIGLALSGMSNPSKVLDFLDVAGNWDPTLAFVMFGALCVTTPGFWLVRRRGRPLFDDVLRLPTRTDIDARLLGGAALFGIGWGISGLCPGPALADIASALPAIGAFIAAMLVGSWFHDRFLAATD